jgi:MFS family permease
MNPEKINFKILMRFKHTLRALKYRNYRLYFAGQGLSLIGTWIQQVAMGWLVYRLTNSAFLLGLVGFVGTIPTFLLTPFAGVFADKWNRRKVLIITQTLSMLQALILAVLALFEIVTIWQIMILATFIGCVNAFDAPTRQSFLLEIVENKEDIGNAIALNSSMFNGARLIGPSIAGIMVSLMGEGICFLVNAISFLTVIAALFMMKIKPRVMIDHETNIIRKMKEGFHYAFNFKPIRYILLLLALVGLMGMPYMVLMPVFARDILHGGPHTLGYLMASVGLGALTGAIYLATRKNVLGLGKWIVRASFIFGSGLILFSLSKSEILSFLILYITGFGMITHIASSNTLIQTIVDDDKRGRVMSLYTLAFMGMAPFGSLLSGSVASKIGAPDTILLGGVFCILGSLIFALKLPSFRKVVRPIYAKMGIIPEVADGLRTATELMTTTET